MPLTESSVYIVYLPDGYAQPEVDEAAAIAADLKTALKAGEPYIAVLKPGWEIEKVRP